MNEPTLIRVTDQTSPFYEWTGRVKEIRQQGTDTPLMFVEFIGIPKPLAFRQSQIKALYQGDMEAMHLRYDFEIRDRGYTRS